MRAQTLINCRDVQASSRWYQRLLGCVGGHGGTEYERLWDPNLHAGKWGSDGLILQLIQQPLLALLFAGDIMRRAVPDEAYLTRLIDGLVIGAPHVATKRTKRTLRTKRTKRKKRGCHA